MASIAESIVQLLCRYDIFRSKMCPWGSVSSCYSFSSQGFRDVDSILDATLSFFLSRLVDFVKFQVSRLGS